MGRPSGFLVAIILGLGASTGGAFLALERSNASVPAGSSAPALEALYASPTAVTEPTLAAAEETATSTPIDEVEAAVATPTITPTPAPEAPEPAFPVATLPANVIVPPTLVSVDEQALPLLHAMNDARYEAALPTLARDSALDSVALVRATDLIENDYFDHYSSTGASAFSELGVRGIAYEVAGENLARNTYPTSRTALAAFDALMGSPAHRANILEPRYAKVGVAAVKSGKSWYYVTVFTN